MIKNILIIVVLALLILSASNTVPAQKASKPESKKTPAPATEDYYREINERLVISQLKQLYEAEAEYVLNFGLGYFGRLQDLRSEGLIDAAIASGEKYGYVFSLTVRQPQVGVPPGFAVEARPRVYRRTGIRSFFMNASCRIHGADEGGFDSDQDDPVIDTCDPYAAYQWEYDISQGMRQMQAAEVLYFNGVGNGSYGSYQDLVDAGLIDYLPSWNWFTWLTVETTAATKTAPASFRIKGTPQIYGETGIRSYFADESGVLRAADLGGTPADANTPPLVFEDEDLIKYALRILWKSQRNYRGLEYLGNGYFATDFETLRKNGLIDFDIKNFEFGGYTFEMTVDNNEEMPWLRNYEIRAVPLTYGKQTKRSFFISDRSYLRGADNGGQPVDSTAPIVEF